MRVSIIFLSFILSTFSAHAMSDQSMNELFRKYDQVMVQKKVELIDQVFSQKFLKENGGKDSFIAKVKELPSVTQKSLPPATKVSWKKGVKKEIFFARIQDAPNAHKTLKKDIHHPEFIVVLENGKLRVDGTISDGE
ncbi:MAG TPA: hypothetical protein VNJ01_15340 [Bacteriovoracaceae bacterium]|nr:hypothetical protein [Bacteriovoracaceae bacterium]